jgi:ubiquitin-activating enzyme E1
LDEDSKNIFLKINTFVKFTGVEGMIELNNSKPIKILNKEDNILTLDINTISFGKYLNRGFISQAKIPLKKSYKSLEDRFEIPYEDKFNEQDYQKEGRNELLFICLKGLNEFCLDNDGNLPEINNYDHTKKFIEITKKIYEEAKNKSLFWTDEIQLWDEKVVEKFSLWSRCEIPPLTSFLGGLISQEIIKYTGKYIPIDQWLFFDFFKAVEQLENEGLKEKIIDDRKILENSRYNDLISIFGNEVFKKLTEKNIFMIGAGAVGCEFLKNLSLIGFSTNKLEENNQNGIISVTDNDNIAVSNLNRQFLFHKENINQSKSKCASDSAKAINRNINIKSYSELVCYENEYLFNDEFWINQDFVICAVDTIDGRKYIDQMCTKYDKILTDSGTNGVEGRFQLIIPYLTSCINDREFKVHYVFLNKDIHEDF